MKQYSFTLIVFLSTKNETINWSAVSTRWQKAIDEFQKPNKYPVESTWWQAKTKRPGQGLPGSTQTSDSFVATGVGYGKKFKETIRELKSKFLTKIGVDLNEAKLIFTRVEID